MSPSSCPDCERTPSWSRREFLATTLKSAAAAAVAPALATSARLEAAAPHAGPSATSETLVATLHKSLTEEQRRIVCFPFEHPLRSKVDNNWQITPKPLNQVFNRDQQALIKEIFLGLHSPEYADIVLRQVEHDSGKDGFFGGSAVALFGEPGGGGFEFVLTGRHCTRRCDGDSVQGAAFGGPIFYGHAAQGFNEKPNHPGNAYWFQAVRANEVWKSLDGRQRKAALLGDGREERGTETVNLTGRSDGLPGLPVADLAPDQKELVRRVMKDLLAPFRKPDADEAMKLIEQAGFDRLHMAFFKNQDVGKDGVWDVWQIEGPSMVWYFRGDPHVHVWVNIRANG